MSNVSAPLNLKPDPQRMHEYHIVLGHKLRIIDSPQLSLRGREGMRNAQFMPFGGMTVSPLSPCKIQWLLL